MTLENLTWAMIGFVLAQAMCIVFYEWSVRVITDKWLAVTAKLKQTCQESVNRAFDAGYTQGYRAAGGPLVEISPKKSPTNEARARLRVVGATLYSGG